MKPRIMLTVIEGPRRQDVTRYNVQDGMGQVITHRPDYLVSPGQQCDLVVSATVMEDRPALGESLVWAVAMGALLPFVPHTHDYCHVPSQRSLSAILADAVQHGVDNPRHGTDCVCMDRLSYEIYHHVLKAVGDDYVAMQNETSDGRTRRLDARFRVAHLLGMIARKL